MSTTYVPRVRPKASRTRESAWVYADGSFDANVDGGQWLGRLHVYLGLPTVSGMPRVPWTATAAQTRAWAERLTIALDMFRIVDGFLVAWRDFLRTCGGYDTR